MSPPTDGQPDELMMSVTADHALKQSEITAIRILSDSVAAVVRAVESMRSDLKDTRDTVIRFEAITTSVTDLRADLQACKTKVDALESDRDRRNGAMGLWEWVFKFTPWVITIVSIVAVAATVRGHH